MGATQNIVASHGFSSAFISKASLPECSLPPVSLDAARNGSLGENFEFAQKSNGKVNANNEAPVKSTRSVWSKASGDCRIPSLPFLGQETVSSPKFK